jgi:coniferyl-aldehyde dehydrogenase
MLKERAAVEVNPHSIDQGGLRALLERQRAAHFESGPLSADQRIEWLDRLIGLMVDFKTEIAEAIDEDFGGRCKDISLLADVYAVIGSYKFAKANLKQWMKPVDYAGAFPDAVARVEYQPVGVVGLMSPWNFPVNLAMGPLAGIVAAGNRCLLKPSELTPLSSALISRMISSAFDPSEIAVVLGGADVARDFTGLAFDHLLFTGGGSIARHVMRAAAENLVPVTLELGGKCPVLVSKSAEIENAAARVLTIKTLNAGQICLAPDYVFLPDGSVDAFVTAATKAVSAMYPKLFANPDYTSVINDHHYARLQRHLADAKAKGATIVEINPAAETFDRNSRRMPPTLVLNVTDDMEIMQDEIFGPVLPVKTYRHIDEAIGYVNSKPSPLALYYFGEGDEQRRVIDRTRSGGVTVNDVMTHAFSEELPFGGVGESGIGSYHGKAGFLNFSHARSVYWQSKAIEAEYALRPPFGEPLRQFLDAEIKR